MITSAFKNMTMKAKLFILFENSHIWGFTAQSSVSRNSSGLMVGEFASSTGAKVIHKSR